MRAPLNLQLAGLYHDVSHSAFSHIADHWKKGKYYDQSQKPRQDRIHLIFLKKHCSDLLKKNCVPLDQMDPERYPMLDCPLPDLCADRIEYITHTALITNLMTPQQVRQILQDLRFENGVWYFTNIRSALLLGELSLHFTLNLWGSPWNFIIYHYFLEALERGVQIHLLELEEFFDGSDHKVLDRLQGSSDPIVRNRLQKCKKPVTFLDYLVTTTTPYHLCAKAKFRGVDPWVQRDGKKIRLTQLHSQYAEFFKRVRSQCESEIKIYLR
jgi:hypothetical protein